MVVHDSDVLEATLAAGFPAASQQEQMILEDLKPKHGAPFQLEPSTECTSPQALPRNCLTSLRIPQRMRDLGLVIPLYWASFPFSEQ